MPEKRLGQIGSANLTHNTQARDIEVGALIDDPVFTKTLPAHGWDW